MILKITALFAFLMACILPKTCFAELDISSQSQQGRLLIHLKQGKGQTKWMTRALELNIRRDLTSFSRIVLIPEEEVSSQSCTSGDLACLLRLYAQLKIDIVLLGQVQKNKADYQIYETWTQSLVRQGSISLISTKSSLLTIRNEILRAVKPFIEKGGLLDQKSLSKTFSEVQFNSFEKPQSSPKEDLTIPLIFVVVMISLWLLLPLTISTLLVRRRRNHDEKLNPTLIPTLCLLIITIASGGILFWTHHDPHSATKLNTLSQSLFAGYSLENIRWGFRLLGGMAYGWFVLINLKLIFPTLYGLRRVRHWNILWLLKSWLTVSILRTAFALLFYLPFFWSILSISELLSFDQQLTHLFIIPLSGMIGYYWVCSILENLSFYLDQEYVYGLPSDENPWHSRIKKYFFGYLKRLGIDTNDPIMNQVLFLPCNQSQILTYGSPLSNPRIVIDQSLLEFALGPLKMDPSHEPPPPDLNEDSSLGLIQPGHYPTDNSKEQRAQFFKHAKKKIKKRNQIIEPESQNFLYGFILPDQMDQAVPLISNNTQDFDTVKQILSDHHSQYQVLDDEEVDDTNPSDRDFLFGLLLHQIGLIKRQENFVLTPIHAYHRFIAYFPKFFKLGFESLIVFYQKLFYRSWAIIADSFSALNFGLHHFVQYLYLFIEYQEDLVTVRADRIRLHRTSLRILNNIKQGKSNSTNEELTETAIKRLVWLSQYFYTPLQEPRLSMVRFSLLAIILTSLGWFSLTSVSKAWNYHPVYLEKIEQEKILIEKNIKKLREATEKK